MFLPAEYAWAEPVVIAGIVLFFVDLIANSIAYGGRFVNGIMTAVVFFIVFAALAYFGLGKLEFSTDAVNVPSLFLPTDFIWLEPVLIATVLVFLVGLAGNFLSFSNRFVNALVTALIFIVVFGVVTYLGYGSVDVDLPALQTAEPPAQ